MASFDGDEELILFQCSTCNVILADTLQSDGANADLGIVSLEDVPDTVAIDSKSKISKDEEDSGCIVSLLSCVSCKTLVGKLYRETTEELSNLQDHACLSLDRLTFYTVPRRNSKNNRSTSQDSKSSEKGRDYHHDDHDMLAEMKSEIHKIQYVICSFDERIKRIEQLLKLPQLDEESERSVEPVRQERNSFSSRNSSKMEEEHLMIDSSRSGYGSLHQRTGHMSDGSDIQHPPERLRSPAKSNNSLGTPNKPFKKSSTNKTKKPKELRVNKRKNVESDEEFVLAGKKQRTNLNRGQYS
ncbi:Protein Mis18-alpha [Holothuria leucospilota]|uniref:Protein Mis18-alpha n=1 Tax=Holothuria leucospilota TaxID=206669 RepID=A0A9Q0YQJ9_HOLLE|nr:Protein Mis18-alpha [Holothuria leucospilota]